MARTKTIPYEVITDTMRGVLVAEINRLSESRASAMALDVITEEEADKLYFFIDELKNMIEDI